MISLMPDASDQCSITEHIRQELPISQDLQQEINSLVSSAYSYIEIQYSIVTDEVDVHLGLTHFTQQVLCLVDQVVFVFFFYVTHTHVH